MNARNVLVPLATITVLILGLYGATRLLKTENSFRPIPIPTPTTSPSPTPSRTIESEVKITIGQKGFNPIILTVNEGTEVTFINNNTVSHTVTAENRAFDSGEIKPGQSFSYTFNENGTYKFYCRYHPEEKGQITVK